MRIFGYELNPRTKELELQVKQLQSQLQAVETYSRGWYPIVREPYAGAWQRNDELRVESVLAHVAVFACVTLIASDIAKMRLRLVSLDADGVWSEVENPAWSPVLRKPNHYQTRQKFIEHWMTSKLTSGKTFVLKRRDARNVVNAMYVLDPERVRPLVAPDGSVFYELKSDTMTGLEGGPVIVPAREIIHDIYIALFHPLIGVSPIFACGLAALQGLKIQNNSTSFFSNGSNPGGVLTAPGNISKETAQRVKAYWETEFSGENSGKVAVLGDGLKFEKMSVSAVDSQLIDQLRWSAEAACIAYRVPPHKISVGQMPNYNNIESLDRQYYSQCLQEKIEGAEWLLDEGLELPKPFGTEFDRDDLFSMDMSTLVKTEKEANGLKTVNESRRRLNLSPVEGGDTVYRQQQDFSIEALNKRDQMEPPPPTRPAPRMMDDEPADAEDETKAITLIEAEFRKALAA